MSFQALDESAVVTMGEIFLDTKSLRTSKRG